MRSCLEIEEDDSEADPHLYLLTASDFLTGLVKIGRSHKPYDRALVLADGMPFHLRVECIYPFAGAKEQEIHEQLRPFTRMVPAFCSIGQRSDREYSLRASSLRNCVRRGNHTSCPMIARVNVAGSPFAPFVAQ